MDIFKSSFANHMIISPKAGTKDTTKQFPAEG